MLVLAAFLAINIPLVLGIYTGLWDAAQFHCPCQMLLGDYAREGRLMLWTPLLNRGYPGVDPICAAFSPLAVGIGALCGGNEVAFRAYWLLIWGLGGVGVILLARHLSRPPLGRPGGRLGAALFRHLHRHAESTSFLPVFSLFPWVLWRLDVALQRRSLLAAAEAGALFGLSALGGYPGLIVIGLGYAALWMAGRFFEGLAVREKGAPAGLPGSAERTVGEPAGVPTARSPTRLPGCRRCSSDSECGRDAADLRRLPGREPRLFGPQPAAPRVAATNENALHPLALCTFASPFLVVLKFADPGALYPGTDVTMCDIYLFPGVLVLAAPAVWQRPRDRFRWCLAAIAVLCLACALGGTLPLRGWLYDWLAADAVFSSSGHFPLLLSHHRVVLALLASRDLQAGEPAATARAWKKFAILGAGRGGRVCRFCPSVGLRRRCRGVWNLLLAAMGTWRRSGSA